MSAPNLEELPPEEGAEIVWDRMRSYMKEKGGKRATDLFKEVRAHPHCSFRSYERRRSTK